MEVLILLVLVAFNGVLTATEIAVVSSRKVRLEQLAQRGARGAGAALLLANDPTRLLATVQIGITLIGIISGALGEASLAASIRHRLEGYEPLARYAHAIAATAMVLTVGFASTLLGELLPKRLALISPEGTASLLAGPMTWLARLATPVVGVLRFSCDLLLKVLRIRAPEDVVSEEEVKGMIAKGTQAGVFLASEQRLVERVFQFGDLRVKALMVPRSDIDWIDASSPISRVRTIVAASPHSHFLVCEGSLDKVVGVVHVKDLIKFGMISGEDVPVGDLARKPLFVPEATKAIKALEVFRSTGQHFAVVVDEFGGTEGLLSLNDLVGAIVGEIDSAGVVPRATAVRREDGTWLIDGSMPVPELRGTLALQPEAFAQYSAVETTGGLVTALLGRVPREGDVAQEGGVRFEVIDMDGRRVDKVLASRIDYPVDEANHES